MKHVVVWAGVASRTHLVYGASWIRELVRREPGGVRVELMDSRTFFGAEAITPAVVGDLLPADVTVTAWQAERVPKDSKLWLLSVGAVGIKPWLKLRALHPARRIPVVVTDEGLSTYGNWAARRQAGRRQGVQEPWLTLRTTAVEAATLALATSRWSLHVETDRGWSLNKPAAELFRELAPAPERRGRVVFLSQPWPELGVLRESQYLDHVDDVARAAARAGLGFVVMPHPGERAGRFSHHEVPPKVDLAEFSPVALGAQVLAGASSTAMLNVAAIHGVPAARVGTPELADLDRRLAPRQASLLAHYATPALSPEDFGRRLSQGFGRWSGPER